MALNVTDALDYREEMKGPVLPGWGQCDGCTSVCHQLLSGGRPNIWEVTCEAIAAGRGAQESLGSPVSRQYLKPAQGPSRLTSYSEAGLPSIPVNMPLSQQGLELCVHRAISCSQPTLLRNGVTFLSEYCVDWGINNWKNL